MKRKSISQSNRIKYNIFFPIFISKKKIRIIKTYLLYAFTIRKMTKNWRKNGKIVEPLILMNLILIVIR